MAFAGGSATVQLILLATTVLAFIVGVVIGKRTNVCPYEHKFDEAGMPVPSAADRGLGGRA